MIGDTLYGALTAAAAGRHNLQFVGHL